MLICFTSCPVSGSVTIILVITAFYFYIVLEFSQMLSENSFVCLDDFYKFYNYSVRNREICYN
ncbi:MAG: hypothetical protein CVU62_10595 [Deltaproteobacteria bacterium HGW-Deltaproteobacteria-2]|nr:MAG: hypothetical protein CVU62_10595 [Deltaproteobacteria bacterium HGW-Deltaproteobacteria-2]